MSCFSYEKKQILVKQISKLKKKDMIKILEIIYADNKNITENQNGLFMYFNKLNDSTYEKIESYLKSVKKANELKETNEIKEINELKESEKEIDETNDTQNQEKNKFITYAKNEFSDTPTQLQQKIKYSNREKNIIKRKRYNEQISENNTDSNIEYTKFNLSDTKINTESETKTDYEFVEIDTDKDIKKEMNKSKSVKSVKSKKVAVSKK